MCSELLADLYERQEDLDPSTFETRASTILVGLGFKSSATDSEGIDHTTYLNSFCHKYPCMMCKHKYKNKLMHLIHSVRWT